MHIMFNSHDKEVYLLVNAIRLDEQSQMVEYIEKKNGLRAMYMSMLMLHNAVARIAAQN